MPTQTDPYLSFFAEQAKRLDDREVVVEQKDKEIREERAQIAVERQQLKAAAEHYQRFLTSRGTPVAKIYDLANIGPEHDPLGALAHLSKPGVSAIGLFGVGSTGGALTQTFRARVGAKRLKVLEAIAEATAAGSRATTRSIRSRTGFDTDLVSNVIWSDAKRGLVARKGDEVSITTVGAEFLRQVGSPYGDAILKSKTPITH